MRARRLPVNGPLTGYAVIILVECLLTALLSRSFQILRIPSDHLFYLFIPVIVLAASVWTWGHALFAVLLALILEDVWLQEPVGQLRASPEQTAQLAIFGCMALTLAILQARTTESRRRLEIHRTVTLALRSALLPQISCVPWYDMGFLFEPASVDPNVGGDFLDVFQISEREVGLLIGDITGHGVELAVQTVQIRHMLEMCAVQGQTPAGCLAAINQMVCNDARFPHMATLLYAALDVGSHTLTYSAAGHPPALLWRDDTGLIEALDHQGVIVGAICDGSVTFSDHRVPLQPGDVLLMYTDGITEARRVKEFYGEARLSAFLESQHGESGSLALPKLGAALREFSRGDLVDDTSAIWIGRQREPE